MAKKIVKQVKKMATKTTNNKNKSILHKLADTSGFILAILTISSLLYLTANFNSIKSDAKVKIKNPLLDEKGSFVKDIVPAAEPVQSETKVKIRAKGVELDGVGADMRIYINSELIAYVRQVNSKDFETYQYPFAGDIEMISVVFNNDSSDGATNSRKLLVDYVALNDTIYQTEGNGVKYDKYDPFDNQDLVPSQEEMTWPGGLHFNINNLGSDIFKINIVNPAERYSEAYGTLQINTEVMGGGSVVSNKILIDNTGDPIKELIDCKSALKCTYDLNLNTLVLKDDGRLDYFAVVAEAVDSFGITARQYKDVRKLSSPPIVEEPNDTENIIIIRAKGALHNGFGPDMRVYVNKKLLYETIEVKETSYKDISLDYTGKVDLVTIQFRNEASGGAINGRKLYIENVTLNGNTINSTDDSVTYDLGAPFDEIDVLPGQIEMDRSGGLNFDFSGVEVPDPTPTGDDPTPTDEEPSPDDGLHKIIIKAKGSKYNGVGPNMSILVNGKIVSTVNEVTNTEFTEFPIDFTGIVNNVAILFTNDQNEGSNDRNLYIDYIMVDDLKINSTDAGVVYDIYNPFDNIDVINSTGNMLWNGSLRFYLTGEGNDNANQNKIIVKAKGTKYNGAGPTMSVLANGVHIGKIERVDNADYQEFMFDYFGIADNISIKFNNDNNEEGNAKNDRNLFVDFVKLNDMTINATDSGVVYLRDDGNTSNSTGNMLWNGELKFDFKTLKQESRFSISNMFGSVVNKLKSLIGLN